MLSKRNPPQNKGHIQTEVERLENYKILMLTNHYPDSSRKNGRRLKSIKLEMKNKLQQTI